MRKRVRSVRKQRGVTLLEIVLAVSLLSRPPKLAPDIEAAKRLASSDACVSEASDILPSYQS